MRIRCFTIFRIHKSILFYNFIEFMILLIYFLESSFSRCKEYIICLISFSNFQMYYLILLVLVLLVIFEAFFWKLIFWPTYHEIVSSWRPELRSINDLQALCFVFFLEIFHFLKHSIKKYNCIFKSKCLFFLFWLILLVLQILLIYQYNLLM